jgi:hypothetical protein
MIKTDKPILEYTLEEFYAYIQTLKKVSDEPNSKTSFYLFFSNDEFDILKRFKLHYDIPVSSLIRIATIEFVKEFVKKNGNGQVEKFIFNGY